MSDLSLAQIEAARKLLELRMSDGMVRFAQRDPRRKLKPIERKFKTWDGTYEKEFYDLQLPSGQIVPNCWPNAGQMVATEGHWHGHRWSANGLVKVRPAENPIF